MTQRLFVTGWLGALAAGIACTPESQSSRTQVVVEEIDAATESLSASDLSAQQEFTEVLARFQPAAEQGDAVAQFNLGFMYANGLGVPKDLVEAHKWRNLAPSRSTGDAQRRYAEARDAMAKQMTPAQLTEAQRLAREWQAAFEERQS